MTPAQERREQRVARLRAAAARKSAAANQRADAGIRRLLRAGEAITFRGVARSGDVSIDFLYRNQELRQRIEQLRAQRAHAARATTPDTTPRESSVVAVLRARLQERHHKEQELRARVRELEQQLAVAHGEILMLRRSLPSSQPANQTSDHPRRRAKPICHERGASG
jgi:Family of unknown function (DUF6262)